MNHAAVLADSDVAEQLVLALDPSETDDSPIFGGKPARLLPSPKPVRLVKNRAHIKG